METNYFKQVFLGKGSKEALIWRGKSYDYFWLNDATENWRHQLTATGVREGEVALLQGDFSPNSIALLLALMDIRSISVPLTNERINEKEYFCEAALGKWIIEVDEKDNVNMSRTKKKRGHQLYDSLKNNNHPGIVFFTSGSTGTKKAVLHDLTRLLKKYVLKRYDLRTLAFLLFDHIGGIDTLFYSLSNGSALIIPEARTVESICSAIERYHVEVMPVSPSFLNLLLMSSIYKHYNLESLKFISYGAEVMPPSTLAKCIEVFPGVQLLQKYGTTEIGTMRSKSEDPSSVWVKIGGEGYEWRIIEGILQIKADSAMLGYLNAPSPFTEDGWFITGDCVERDGNSLKILGRTSDIINVGGQKVYPAEVEEVICQMEDVADATVYGEKNLLLGNVVCAKVKPVKREEIDHFTNRLREHCRNKLEKYKVPLKFIISEDIQFDSRSKKVRRLLAGNMDSSNDR